jgi:hypothetical protein
LPVVGGGDWVPTAEHVEAWRAAYPGVDLTREWAAMRSWLLANPTRGKTRRGMAAFVNRWLGKAQDDSGRTVRPGGGGARAGADARYLEGNKGKVGGVLNMGGDND